MTWFIIEFVVVCALITGFMATHSLAAAIVSATPVVFALVWLRSIGADEAMLWLVGGVPLLAGVLGLALGWCVRHRVDAHEAAVRSPERERPAPGRVSLDVNDAGHSATVHDRMPVFITAKVADARDHGRWTEAGSLATAIAGGAGRED